MEDAVNNYSVNCIRFQKKSSLNINYEYCDCVLSHFWW